MCSGVSVYRDPHQLRSTYPTQSAIERAFSLVGGGPKYRLTPPLVPRSALRPSCMQVGARIASLE